MRIPNKFNGYSADNRRVYNDPATATITIANMGEGVAIANALAASQAAAAAATAAAAEQAAAQAAAQQAGQQAATQAATQQAGQAGIMQGSAVPPPGATPPGVPGLGAPMPPATPLPPAGGTPFTPPAPAGVDAMGVPDVTSGGINPVTSAGQTPPPSIDEMRAMGERFAANSPPAADPNNLNYLNSSTAQAYGEPILPRALDTAVDPTKVFDPTKPFTNPTYPSLDVVKPVVETVKPATGGSGFMDALSRGASRAYDIASQGAKDLYEGYKAAPAPLQYLSAGMAAKKFLVEEPKGPEKYKGPRANMSAFLPDGPQMPSTYLYGANGGIMQSYAEGGVPTSGGPVEQMSNMNVNAMGGNMMYPMSQQHTNVYGTGINQRPMSVDMLTDGANNVDPYTGEQHSFAEGGLSIKDYQRMSGGRSGTDLENDIAQAQHAMAKAKGHEGLGKISRGRGTAGMSALDAAMADINALNKKTGIKAAPMAMAKMSDPTAGNHVDDASYAEGGGIAYHLGGYSDGGRLLKGPGDGVSDSIPATIGRKQPARLADGEFVIPARIVSELGNGSTEAGARQLYAMMDRVQHGRKKSIGKGKVAVNSKANKHLPA